MDDTPVLFFFFICSDRSVDGPIELMEGASDAKLGEGHLVPGSLKALGVIDDLRTRVNGGGLSADGEAHLGNSNVAGLVVFDQARDIVVVSRSLPNELPEPGLDRLH